MKKAAIGILILSIITAILPLASVLLAGLAASLFGCQLDESGTSMCPTIFGDIGGLLSLMGMFGWLVFYSVPLGFAGALGGGVLLFFELRNGGRKETPEA